MKVVLLALSGDLSRWHDKLVQLYPDSSIEMISRAEFETGSHIKRLKSLRALRPDVPKVGDVASPERTLDRKIPILYVRRPHAAFDRQHRRRLGKRIGVEGIGPIPGI